MQMTIESAADRKAGIIHQNRRPPERRCGWPRPGYDPGEAESAQHDLSAARRALEEAEVLRAAGYAAGAVSRLYHCVFRSARAALKSRGLSTKTHSGQIYLYEQTFGAAPVLSDLFQLHALADYSEEGVIWSDETLQGRQEAAISFLRRCEDIVRKAIQAGPDAPDPAPDIYLFPQMERGHALCLSALSMASS